MTTVNDTDIAIVGLALRVPGAATPETFWQNLKDGVESLQIYTDEELIGRGVSQARLNDPNYVKAGMPLDSMEDFDPEFFGFSPKEAAILDPQHRLFYEVAWEALERAGHPPARFEGNVGVFAGSGMAAYFAQNILTNPDLVDSVGMFLLRHTGNDKDFLATRVSYAFDLKGPSINVQTACSTSLVAIHLAAQSLLAGECDMALAGGATIELPHRTGYLYKEGEILSPDGHCRPFDHQSKGTVFGSGCGIVALRRLSDALESGDHVHAVIKGTAVNNDGAGKVGYLAPSVDGQAAAVAEALAISDVPAETVGYVECHGTGTPVGDPIEVAALTSAFREFTELTDFCRIGSVKSNIGHTDTAAGVLGLIKAALAVEHGQIPPSIGFEAPNPTINFEGSPFSVAAQLKAWHLDDGPRRAGVNSLGVGGTNAFAILEQAPQVTPAADDVSPQPLVVTARTPRALDEACTRLAAHLQQAPEQPLADVAWTLLQGRHAFEHKRVLAAAGHDEAIALLNEPDARRVFTHNLEFEQSSVVFMYPGGGAQYFNMGNDLYAQEAVFREHMDSGLALLKSRFNVDLTQIFLADSANEQDISQELARPSVQLPLIFMVEVALTHLWARYGVEPAAVTGHSLGENTAAHIAGVLSFEDALGLVLLRGQLMEEAPEGAMLSVSMPAHELREELGDELDLAAANSPQLAVASGSEEQITALHERLTEKGIDSQRVNINIAAHSRLLDSILERFADYLNNIQLSTPTLPVISNLNGTWISDDDATSPEYWVQHLRNSVLFAEGVDTLLESDDRIFLEVGPGQTLGSLVRQNPKATAQRVLATLRHPDDPVDDFTYMRTTAGRLWALGVEFDCNAMWNARRHRTPLPTYPFQHSTFWIEPGSDPASSMSEDSHPMKLQEFSDWFQTPRWVQQGVVNVDDDAHTWLVFLTDEPAGQSLAGHLREGGHKVVTVLAGDTYTRISENEYIIAPEAGGSGYLELIESLTEDGLLPDRILHTWLLTWDTSFRPGSTFFHRNQEFGFYSLFHLAQALGKTGHTDAAIHWLVAANGSQKIADESIPYPDKATALGPCAVIPREFSNTTCRFIDIELPAISIKRRRPDSLGESSKQVADALINELNAAPDNTVVGWRNGVRWQRHLGSWQPGQGEGAQRLREGGVYLITGGLGGIAGQLAQWLITRYKARVALLGRTPLPARKDWDDWLANQPQHDAISRAIQRVRRLEAAGESEVLVLSADVTVAEQMQEAVAEIREQFGEIHGVFHTAGVVRDNLIQLKGQRDIEDVFAAKVYGTEVLKDSLRNETLDFMVLFSSNSAFVAPQGQVDYVAANAFLNAWAASRHTSNHYPILAVNWGIWKDVGMVAREERSTQGFHSVAYPLFNEHTSSRDGISLLHTLRGSLLAKDNWVVDDHRLRSGAALLSGTGYIELIRAALAECGINSPWELRNLIFHNPLFVADKIPQPFEVRLLGNELNWQAEIAALDPSTEDWAICATARITSMETAPQNSFPIVDIQSRCTLSHTAAGGSGALITRQEDHLDFGPRWRVLKSLDLGKGEALAKLELPGEFLSDTQEYLLHPALLDIATGCAMDLIPGYEQQQATKQLWAPLSYKGLIYHRPLPFRLISWIRLNANTRATEGFAVFDVVIANEDGQIVAEVNQLTLRRLKDVLQPPPVMADTLAITTEGAPLERTPTKPLSPGEIALAHNAGQGIEASEGTEALGRLLAAAELPSTVVVSSLAIPDLLRQAETISKTSMQTADTRFSRPELGNEFEAPTDEIEQALTDLWGKLLGVEGIGIKDSFFDLGGHSLIAVRLFNEITDRYGVDLPMSVLMQSPTVAALADLIREATGDIQSADANSHLIPDEQLQKSSSFHYIVPMHSGPVADGTPLFMVAGMFGNVLNLSHMAHLLGEDRPFFALQARGLYGNAEPHEDFETMANDYLKEIRKVQPHGPYLLGGYSGGGLVAYEIARQLMESGEQIQQVIFLDTPIPGPSLLSLGDRAEMFLRGLIQSGPSFILQRLKERMEWEKRKRSNSGEGADNYDVGTFQSQSVGNAFTRANARYTLPSVHVSATLLRPKLDTRFTFQDGRRINSDRRYIAEDNFWTPYVKHLKVIEVPGNHDNMVLEPNVRVLAVSLRNSIEQAENQSERLHDDPGGKP